MPYFSATPFPTFQQAYRLVTGITSANPAVVTTSFAHQYLSGLIVRLIVPRVYGMVDINNMTGTITVLSPTTFSIDIDSTNFNPFTYPGPTPPVGTTTPAQVIPIGEINSILTQATYNALPY
jgi:hypothetical protein